MFVALCVEVEQQTGRNTEDLSKELADYLAQL